jgi:hypothetical protein
LQEATSPDGKAQREVAGGFDLREPRVVGRLVDLAGHFDGFLARPEASGIETIDADVRQAASASE